MINLVCDHCNRLLPETFFAETIEEYLCETCASGIDYGRDDDDEDSLEEPGCPQCGSYELRQLAMPNGDGSTEYYCEDCGLFFVDY